MANIDNLQNGLSGTIVITTNADWRDTLQFLQGETGGAPLDITGIEFVAQLRQSVGDPGVLLNMSTANGLLVVDGQLGQLSFAVPRDEPATGPSDHTSNLPVGSAVLDIVAFQGSVIKNVCQASGGITVLINRGVTRQ